MHAKVNDLVARWTQNGTKPDNAQTADLRRMRTECKEGGFGHLVPRIDYLLAVDAVLRWRLGDQPVESVDSAIAKANAAARRYGYGEYIWLLGSLELIRLIEGNASGDQIIRKATWLIDHLHDHGLTFVAGDELCFQNTVALSNGLLALHQKTDQETAWLYAQKISFSPLFIPKPSDQRQRLETVFRGEGLNHIYDPRALVKNADGYSIILV